MKNKERIIYGFIITIFIFLIANILGDIITLNVPFITDTFYTHTIMIILTTLVLLVFKTKMTYNLTLPRFKTIFKPILVGILIALVVNILMTIIIKLLGGKMEEHSIVKQMSPAQVIVFVFLYASIAEELLFRGFLLNFLESDKLKGIKIIKRKFSIPVIISAVLFGLSHLILITTGAGFLFLLKIIIFTSILGLFAGYYQEKYNNNIYAILVHMSGNLFAVISAFLTSING
jgi:membrane protease YdiL (CAAX protease family)